jgi:hypothetical protein
MYFCKRLTCLINISFAYGGEDKNTVIKEYFESYLSKNFERFCQLDSIVMSKIYENSKNAPTSIQEKEFKKDMDNWVYTFEKAYNKQFNQRNENFQNVVMNNDFQLALSLYPKTKYKIIEVKDDFAFIEVTYLGFDLAPGLMAPQIRMNGWAGKDFIKKAIYKVELVKWDNDKFSEYKIGNARITEYELEMFSHEENLRRYEYLKKYGDKEDVKNMSSNENSNNPSSQLVEKAVSGLFNSIFKKKQ